MVVRVGCRIIVPDDAAALVALLSRGFPERTPGYWTAALSRLADRPAPPDFPRFGFCLTADDRIVGVVLLIHARPTDGGTVRCCVSSWYVEPDYRVYASILARIALRRTDCVYINMSSEASTRDGLAAQGYARYVRGQVVCCPALGRRVPGTAIERVSGAPAASDGTTTRLLKEHAEMGCIAFYCVSGATRSPFVFLKRKLGSLPLSCAQLVFCESVASFAGMQGPIGRYLLRFGLGLVMLDANHRVEGVAGFYLDDRMPKYYKGSVAPRLGDLSYSEAALFGP